MPFHAPVFAAEPALRDVPAARIVTAVAGAAERWSNPDFPPRVRAGAALERRLGYSPPVVEYALDRLFSAFDAAALQATIASELGSLEALDGFIARPGRPDAFACGIERVAILASDTTIGVALVPAVFALCAKADVVVKDRVDGLAAAFFSTLAEERPEFVSAARALQWQGGAHELETELFERAGAVVAFGRDATLERVRARCAPQTRFIGYGHRASLGYFTREALATSADASRWCDGAARDALLYDGDGCLNAHALFVENGGALAPAELAELLARALDRAALEFPASDDPERAARALSYRRLAAFRAAGGRGAVYGWETTAVVFDPPRDEPPPFIARTLTLIPVEGPREMLAYVRAHALALEAVGIAGTARDDVVRAAVEAGAVRLAMLGELQRPTVRGDHGGYGRIAHFVRWIDRET